ncbi:MAG: TonB family protein [candidate division Zixibacteria bacterium]|nr:TonB family protein [candidate division Zixibacteria bacterium]
MNLAIVISLVLHMLIFTYLFWGEKRGQKDAYPAIMTVDLVSMPPISRGVNTGTETPGTPQVEATKPKAQTKVEQKPTTPRVAEVKKRKRTNTKKPKPKPQTKTEKADNEKKTKNTDQPGAGDERFGLPEGVDYGSEFGSVKLEGDPFETPTFLNILFAKIKTRWDNPYQGTGKVICTIYFTILRNGTVVDAIIEQSSGISAFDQSALRAVISSSPPPLPMQYTGNQLGIHLQFQYLP